MYLNCFIERKSGLMTIKRRVEKIEEREQNNCFGTCYVVVHRKSFGNWLEKIEERILNDKVREQYEIVGNGKFPINDEFKVIIKDNVVTITDNDNKKNREEKIW